MADQDSEQKRIVSDDSRRFHSFLSDAQHGLSISMQELRIYFAFQLHDQKLFLRSPEDSLRYYEGAVKLFEDKDTCSLTNIHARLDNLETAFEHAIRPTIAAMARHIWSEKDTLPPASSIEYELFDKLAELQDVVRAIIDHYSDQDERLNYYVLLISRLKDIIDKTRTFKNRFFSRAVLMLYDSLSCMYSEDLTQEQLKTIYVSIVTLQEPDWDKNKLRALNKHLRSSGFETIPSDRFGVQEKKREHANIP